MKDDKILNNEYLNDVNGGGIFGNETEQRFKVGDEVIAATYLCNNVSSIRIEAPGVIVECLGLEGVFYGTYEYNVRFENGEIKKVTQAHIKKR